MAEEDIRPAGAPEPVGQAHEYGEYDVDADVGNVPVLLIWVFVAVLSWGIFSWIPFFGGVKGSYW